MVISIDNILIENKEDMTSVKIADFGLGTRHRNQTELEIECGTLLYMAPEAAFSYDYSKKVDVWSLGVIMYQLLTGGKHPLYIPIVDKVDSFKAKLKAVDTSLPVTEDFSWLATNLYEKLTKV